MKIVNLLLGERTETTLDALLDDDIIQNLFSFTIRHQHHRDFFEAYCLVRGITFPIVDWGQATAELFLVEILFPELEL